MVLVDSSVWIDHFLGKSSPETRLFHELLGDELILTGDLILVEVLRGFRSDADYRRCLDVMSSLPFEEMVGREIGLLAAQNYRKLRKRGHTVRKTIDLIIASFCVHNDYDLLHADRDFDAMAPHIGLRTL